jgi:hypothetical protein
MSKRISVARRHLDLPKPYFVAAMAEINAQTSRGAAIAGTAFLDLLLRSVIEKRIRPLEDISTLLFENRGPLQEFSARIVLAFALEIIGTGAYLDLCILREIRNAFAHSAEAIDFDRPDVSAKCAALWYPLHISYEGRPPPVSPREKFVRAIEFLADGLFEELSRKPGGSPPSFIRMGPPWSHAQRSSPRKRKLQSPPADPTRTQKSD